MPQRQQEANRPAGTEYILEDQIGHILRRAWQRHAAIFSAGIGGDLTPMQFAVLAKLAEIGSCSQNQLGRLVAMDAATTKGVIERLAKRGLIETERDPNDRRRRTLSLSREGARFAANSLPRAEAITAETLQPLSAGEQATLLMLLQKLT